MPLRVDSMAKFSPRSSRLREIEGLLKKMGLDPVWKDRDEAILTPGPMNLLDAIATRLVGNWETVSAEDDKEDLFSQSRKL